MNLLPLALGLVFTALAVSFLAQGKKETDAARARNLRFGGGMMAAAGLAMIGVALFTYFRGQA